MPARRDPGRLTDHALTLAQAGELIGKSPERVRIWCNLIGDNLATREGPQHEWRVDPLAAWLTAYFVQGRRRVTPSEIAVYLGYGAQARREALEIIRDDPVWRERFAELWRTNVKAFLAERKRQRRRPEALDAGDVA